MRVYRADVCILLHDAMHQIKGATVLSAIFHKQLVEKWSDFEGKVSLGEGVAHGLAVGVGVHLALPFFSVVAPEVITQGLANYEAVDWVTTFPLELYEYVTSLLPPITSFLVNSRALMGCADLPSKGVGTPHQCPLGLVAS